MPDVGLVHPNPAGVVRPERRSGQNQAMRRITRRKSPRPRLPESASQNTVSYWNTTTVMPAQPPLVENLRTEVCVVGAGISGLTAAYLLARAGRSVVVLDDGPVGGGETQRTSAHLSYALDDRFYELERIRGAAAMALAVSSHREAIDRIEAIVRTEKIVCSFKRVNGYLFLGEGHKPGLLDREMAAAKRAGVSNVELFAQGPLTSYEFGPCLRFPGVAQFNPIKYLKGLLKGVQSHGGRVFSGAHAQHIEGGDRARIETRQGRHVSAEAAIIATNSPVTSRLKIPLKQAAYTTYVIAAQVPAGAVPAGLYWDTQDPYHYIRVQRNAAKNGDEPHEFLIVGGEDHRTGQANDGADRFARLEEWARNRFPMMQAIAHRWSGQVMETMDGLAYIGPQPGSPRVFMATGDSGMGLTHGTIAGILLTELIAGRGHPWAKLYDPSRLPVRGLGSGVREDLSSSLAYRDWVTAGDVSGNEEIQAGCGAIVRHGLKKSAVYRDEQGRLHEYSAVCPHLGGLVRWNSAEKTWDCPCHGSRFDRYGEVLQGPANSNLLRHPVSDQAR